MLIGTLASRRYRWSSVAVGDAYQATVKGIADLLAYWRLGEGSGPTATDTAGARNGTYQGTVTFARSALPAGTPNTAIDFAGTGYVEVPHDSGLELAAVTVSLWFKANSFWAPQQPIFSKDLSGLNQGDFAIWVEDDGDLIVQSQSSSAQFRVVFPGAIAVGQTCHVAARLDGTGIRAWLNGAEGEPNTGFTTAWQSNSVPIRLGAVAWTNARFDGVIDEVALYSRALGFAEILQLAQRTSDPVAVDDSATVVSGNATPINVTANDAFVGRKQDLAVELRDPQPALGSVAVAGDNDIVYTAAGVPGSDSFGYRITDANGTSPAATVTLTVAAGEGGELVLDWTPQASQITGVALNNRRGLNAFRFANGSQIAPVVTSPDVSNCCLNFAPDGTPALEIRSASGSNSGGINISFDNFGTDGYQGKPRHVRVQCEVRVCRASDPTTHKPNGLGTTSGSYPDFQFDGPPGKAWLGMYAGQEPRGGGQACCWAQPQEPVDRAGYRVTWGGSNKDYRSYMYVYSRAPNASCGGAKINGSQCTQPGGRTLVESGAYGKWVRIEMELKLSTPGSVPDNGNRTSPCTKPDHTGDGWCKIWATNDIDGMPGPRTLVVDHSVNQNDSDGRPGNMLFFPKSDSVTGKNNLHLDTAPGANIRGLWLHLFYGGSDPASQQQWSWLRNIKVWRLD